MQNLLETGFQKKSPNIVRSVMHNMVGLAFKNPAKMTQILKFIRAWASKEVSNYRIERDAKFGMAGSLKVDIIVVIFKLKCGWLSTAAEKDAIGKMYNLLTLEFKWCPPF